MFMNRWLLEKWKRKTFWLFDEWEGNKICLVIDAAKMAAEKSIMITRVTVFLRAPSHVCVCCSTFCCRMLQGEGYNSRVFPCWCLIFIKTCWIVEILLYVNLISPPLWNDRRMNRLKKSKRWPLGSYSAVNLNPTAKFNTLMKEAPFQIEQHFT